MSAHALTVVPSHLRGSYFPLLMLEDYGWKFASSFLFFVLLNLLAKGIVSRFPPKDPARGMVDLSSPFTATIHAVIVSSFSVYGLYTNLIDELLPDRVWAYTPLTSNLMTFSAGYMLYDFVHVCLFWKSGDLVFFLHHLCSFIIFGYGSMRPVSHYQGIVFLMWETSTPFLNFRKMFWVYSIDHTSLAWINERVFAFTFFLARILFGSFFVYKLFVYYLFHYDSSLQVPFLWRVILLVGNGVINLLNVYWFSIILGKILPTKSKKIHLD